MHVQQLMSGLSQGHRFRGCTHCPHLPPAAGRRSGRTGVGRRCLPGFPFAGTHPWVPRSPSPAMRSPFAFPAGSSAVKPLNLTRSTQAFNGRLLKQIFCAFSMLASELAPGCLQRMAYLGVCSETWQESLLQRISRSFHETVACA